MRKIFAVSRLDLGRAQLVRQGHQGRYSRRRKTFIECQTSLNNSSFFDLIGQRQSSFSSASTSSSPSSSSPSSSIYSPIIIVGGGPTGLCLANLLQQYGTPFILLEGQTPSERFKHPQAHFLNTRTMEILKHFPNSWMKLSATTAANENNDNNNDNNNTSSIYEQVCSAMPPVSEWESFYFGANMRMLSKNDNDSNNDNRMTDHTMAHVIHPVAKPLVTNQDSNGKLVQQEERQRQHVDGSENGHNDMTKNQNVVELSDCTVGHLAQHTFCQILYKTAMKHPSHSSTIMTDKESNHNTAATQSHLLFGTKVETYTQIQRNCINNDDDDGNNHHHGSGSGEKEENKNDTIWTIRTTCGKEFLTPILIAADGSKSSLRQQELKINMLGRPTIQHLINVHFTTTTGRRKKKITNNKLGEEQNDDDYDDGGMEDSLIPPGMLYTIFSSKVLAMIVRHSAGEYVMQIPYFPPYQTLEDNFSTSQVTTMLDAVFGNDYFCDNEDNDNVENSNNNGNKGRIKFQIHSIQPWTMGSLVAQDYFKDNVFLAGDAAHVFPPAGGLGMNTGMQDVFTLAWRLAALVKQQQEKEKEGRHHHIQSFEMKNEKEIFDDGIDTKDGIGSRGWNCSSIGELYQLERRPVAQQNAALSVRNYHRVLKVMESCYLNHQHPKLLIQTLDTASTALNIPISSIQRQTFQSLYEIAMSPLRNLLYYPNGLYSKHVKQNLRTVLQNGQGLPLLFPNHEIGYIYKSKKLSHDKEEQDNADNDNDHDDDWSKDTLVSQTFPRRIYIGALFPHINVQVTGTKAMISKQDNTMVKTLSSPSTLDIFPNLCRTQQARIYDDDNNDVNQDLIITTRDLPAQLVTTNRPCVFCILHIIIKKDSSAYSSDRKTNERVDDDDDETNATSRMLQLQYKLEQAIGLPFVTAKLFVSDDTESADGKKTTTKNNDVSIVGTNNDDDYNDDDKSKLLCLHVDYDRWKNSYDFVFEQSTNGAINHINNTIRDHEDEKHSLTKSTSSLLTNQQQKQHVVVVIRPDGHIASIVNNNSNGSTKELIEQKIIHETQLTCF